MRISFCKFCLFAGLLIGAVACSSKVDESVSEMDESHPYSVEIKRTRSYFAADKISHRLTAMSVDNYVRRDSSESGEWYVVMSGACGSREEAAAICVRLDSMLGMSVDTSSAITHYADVDSTFRLAVDTSSVDEVALLDANTPDVPKSVMLSIGKFPVSNAFELEHVGIVNLEYSDLNEVTKDRRIDMPRGVKVRQLKKAGAKCMSVAFLEDNLTGENVTMHILTMRTEKQFAAAMLPTGAGEKNKDCVDLCLSLAEAVLATGQYAAEMLVPIDVKAGYANLAGYSASFDESGVRRTYYFLTDEDGDFVYFLQFTKLPGAWLDELIARVGMDYGLDDYAEFRNTFYTIADRMSEDDLFIGYFDEVLTHRYARDRGYARWARKMVGCHSATALFTNNKKGVWGFTLFDLVTNENGSHIYKELYVPRMDKDNLRTIYGEKGVALYDYNWLFGKVLSEVSFGRGRYIVAIAGNVRYTEKEFITRGERMQLKKGGY